MRSENARKPPIPCFLKKLLLRNILKSFFGL
jgi:hypothetical protein